MSHLRTNASMTPSASPRSASPRSASPPPASRFAWAELRTTDPAAARGFYGAIFGEGALRPRDGRIELIFGGVAVGEIGELPAIAAARGAPAHWLGHLHVADVDASVDALVGRGAVVLGPRRRIDDHAVAGLRGPCGEVTALTSRPPPPIDPGIWYDLAVADPARALAIYGERFGWAPTDVAELDGFGAYRRFAWRAGGGSVGGALSNAGRPEIHDHWLHSFPVDDLDRAIATIVERGGEVVGGPMTTDDGRRAASFHDPQGALFGLWARA